MPSVYLTAKLAAAAGGLLGGLTMMTFIKPKTILDATIRGGISTGSGIIFSTPLLQIMELSIDWEYQLFFGFIIGFLSWSILSLVANVFIKAEKNNEDIIELAKKVKK